MPDTGDIGSRAAEKPVVVFFAQDRMDARVVKRIRALRDEGWHVLGFTFLRAQDRAAVPPEWENIDLGTTWSRRYVQRAWALIRSLGIVWRHRRRIGEARCFYAINGDNALLALWARFAVPGALPLVTEIADIRSAMTGTGIAARFMRKIERFVLRRTRLLVTTSPGFIRAYFQPVQRFNGEVFLLENKVYPSSGLIPQRPAVPRPPVHGGRPWVIGYFGALRCERSLRLIRELALRLGDRVRFVLRGHFFGARASVFDEISEGLSNISFGGPYRYPEDLAEMYNSVDFNWCFDWLDEGANSAWLLPNRIYEGGLFGIPMLAAAGTETGRRVEETRAGWSIGEGTADALTELFTRLGPDEWKAVHGRILAAETAAFTAEEDYRILAERMRSLT